MSHSSRPMIGVVGVAALLLGCSTTVPTSSPTFPSAVPTVGSTDIGAPTSAAAPTPTQTTTGVALPNPGGTCLAEQFIVVASAASQFVPSTISYRHVFVSQRLRNAGPDCVLAQPKVVGLASAIGPLQPFALPNLGHTTCANNACHNVYPTSVTVRAGQSVTLELNASWWSPATPDDGTTPLPAPPCGEMLNDVDRAAVPFSSGDVEFGWETTLVAVCGSPSSISLGIETT